MRIKVFGVHNGEIEALEKWQERNKIELSLSSEILSIANVDEIVDFDGVCLQQVEPVEDEEIYRKISEFGVKQITVRTAGYDMIDLEYAHKYHLLVTNVPAYSPNAIAEMALTHTMNLIRKMYITQLKVARKDFTWDGSLAPEIRMLTIGIIGVGRIGGVYAKLVAGLGAKVIGYDIAPNQCINPDVEYQDSLDDVLQKADLISLHVPLDQTTEYLINKDTLKLMKTTAYLVNTSRGKVVNSSALINALENGELAGAALDVIEEENEYFGNDYSAKIINDKNINKFLELENVYVTPHIAFYTKTALQNMVDISLDSVVDIVKTGSSKNIIK